MSARKGLLAEEKELRRRRDAINMRRRALPMVEIEKDDVFDGPNGTIDESRGYGEYNFRALDEYAAMGQESMKTLRAAP